ncbi:RDD family protein [Candidatus Gottesmanbacteria bacterium]|nr:RDD family protein [Candidatus Gottesmanbacteria bacterium]
MKLKDQYASFLDRFLAYLVDSYFVFFTALVIFLLFKKINNINSPIFIEFTYLSLIYLIVFCLYFLVCWVNLDGKTVGMGIIGIRVIRDRKNKLNYKDGVKRLFAFSLILMCTGGLAFLSILFNKKKQGFHDQYAKTLVIYTVNKPNRIKAIIISILLLLISTVINYSYFFSRISNIQTPEELIQVYFGDQRMEKIWKEMNTTIIPTSTQTQSEQIEEVKRIMEQYQ